MKSKKKKKGLTEIYSDFKPKAQKKRTEHTLCVTKPYAKLAKGGPYLNFAYFSIQFYNPGHPKGGGRGTMSPSKYAPETKLMAVANLWHLTYGRRLTKSEFLLHEEVQQLDATISNGNRNI